MTPRGLELNIIISNSVKRVLALIVSLTPQDRIALFEQINKVSPPYVKIMELHNKGDAVDVSTDSEFQISFNKFYGVYAARRNLQWRNKFYKLFQTLRLDNVKNRPRDIFKNISNSIHRYCKQWEYSFSTKMLHTLNDNQPIVDSKVLRLLDIPVRGQRDLQKLLGHYDMYSEIIFTLLNKIGVKEILNEFDQNCSQLRHISRVKKLDFFLWQFRNV